jgi:predicted regulator of Ras-like GTPase activity (Roadblock/LC7/MglB family)
VFLNIAHRSQSIIHRQLKVLDEVERAETDPDQLARLFQLDHLATRERRNAENLIVLGGGTPGRQWREPVPLIELIRSAISEAVHYNRVEHGRIPAVPVVGPAVADLIHLLAELLDNATAFSPPDTPILVRGNLVGRGLVVEIEDQGLGIPAEQREQLNTLLSDPPDFGMHTLSEETRLGLFVVARLPTGTGSASRCSSPRTAGYGPSSSSRPTCWPSRARRPTCGPPSTAPHHLPADPRSPRTVPRRRRRRCRRPGHRSGRLPRAPLPEPPGTRPPSRSPSTRLGPSCRNGGGWTTSSLSCPTDPPRPARRATNQTPVPTALRRTSMRVPAAPGTRSVRCSGGTRVCACAPVRRGPRRPRRGGMMTTGSPRRSVQWLLDDLVDRIRGGDRVVLVSRDGLLIARSSGLDDEGGEHLAALASALQGLARSASRQLQVGRPRQTMLEMDEAFLLVTTAGDGTSLAVVVPADADLGQVAYEINRLVNRVGSHLSVRPAASAGTTTPGRAVP